MLVPSIFGENLLDDWMGFDPFREVEKADRKLYGHKGSRMMSTDVRETDAGYELDIDLPGFKKDEINVKLENGYLTVSASKSLNQEEKKEGKLIRQERYSGAMQRSFYVGDAITEEDVNAKFEEGVLKVGVPKKDAKAIEQAHTIEIE